MAAPSPSDDEDALAEAEAMMAATDLDAGDPEGGDEDGEDLGGEDLGGGADEDCTAVEPKYIIGQALEVLRSEGVFAPCTIVAADQTEMGPMYAVRLEDGQIQSLVPEDDLRLTS
eukprot:TRINITY_DN79683_c0_g1_i1.p1 TRINITY_DN79683_c0_g1~~TRINITY_DN79683_c0_g1_i1.p1  ORF type:complete len:115 (+),score=33.92 TRINITY_DN79683_c0_g1_i1:43-387(+)